MAVRMVGTMVACLAETLVVSVDSMEYLKADKLDSYLAERKETWLVGWKE